MRGSIPQLLFCSLLMSSVAIAERFEQQIIEGDFFLDLTDSPMVHVFEVPAQCEASAVVGFILPVRASSSNNLEYRLLPESGEITKLQPVEIQLRGSRQDVWPARIRVVLDDHKENLALKLFPEITDGNEIEPYTAKRIKRVQRSLARKLKKAQQNWAKAKAITQSNFQPPPLGNSPSGRAVIEAMRQKFRADQEVARKQERHLREVVIPAIQKSIERLNNFAALGRTLHGNASFSYSLTVLRPIKLIDTPEQPQFRTWRSVSGKSQVVAQLVAYHPESGLAKLKRQDTGKIVEVRTAKLSQDDRDYLKSIGQVPMAD